MRKRIMVVEDDEPILQLMEILLQKLGYEPQVYINGVTALAELKERQPSLILLDVMMMPINGWEFLEKLRADPASKDLPVILFTAHPDVKAQMLGIHDPRLGVLFKPVGIAELEAALERFLGPAPAKGR
jgi:DNA-binding response OmpR family regulator